MIKRWEKFLESSKIEIEGDLLEYFHDIEDDFLVDVECIIRTQNPNYFDPLTIRIIPIRGFKFGDMFELIQKIGGASEKMGLIGDFQTYPHNTNGTWGYVQWVGLSWDINNINIKNPEKIIKKIEEDIDTRVDLGSTDKNWRKYIDLNMKIWLDFVKK